MTSRAKRRGAKNRKKKRPPQGASDPHASILLDSVISMATDSFTYSDEADPRGAIRASILELTKEIRGSVAPYTAVQTIEAARVLCLPWTTDVKMPASAQSIVDSEGGPTKAELLALIALSQISDAAQRDEEAQPQDPASARVLEVVSQVLPSVGRILQLANMYQTIDAEADEPLGMLATMMRGAEMWVRNSSYPEMVEETLLQLLGRPEVRQVLRDDLGFDAGQAVRVMTACHDLQVARFNSRRQILPLGASQDPDDEISTEDLLNAFQALEQSLSPSVEAVSTTLDEICSALQEDPTTVKSVLDYFSFDPSGLTAEGIVIDFISGKNPLRQRPVIRASSGAAMLVHSAHVLTAVRERLEEHLKKTRSWERYQKHRGDVLEKRTGAALMRVLPSAMTLNAFEYYIPENEHQEQGPPTRFTKKVEGDHLFVQDDVALIVEDKAVAVSGSSRAGDVRSLRRDLRGIITKASSQASRLQERIQRDGGILVHRHGWVDLSHVREIHMIAVGLDDLMFASTATAELVKGGILHPDKIPWTVSIHDLELITQLIDLPAEFLLYLRRRRDPEATVFYTAPDELDLFLYFLEAGLYVEPDPDLVHSRMPFMPPPTTAERRRRKNQTPAIITNRTEPLDRWFASQVATMKALGQRSAGGTDDGNSAPDKPRMSPSAMRELATAVESHRYYGWLSIGATLLSASAEFQKKMASLPAFLRADPAIGQKERTVAIPFGHSLEEGWLLIWCTRLHERNFARFEEETREYLRVKKHQLGFPRGAAFVYDLQTNELADVFFDDHIGDLEPKLLQKLGRLRNANDFDHLDQKTRSMKANRKRNYSSQ